MGLLDLLVQLLGLRQREVNILVVGLDNSGKTSILNYLRPKETRVNASVPTVGFNIENFTYQGLSFTAFDMSGQSRYRTLWGNYYRTSDGIIFVIDSSDKARILVAREELQQLLVHPDVLKRKTPILLFANKMDVRDALSDVGVSSALGLENITNKSWYICSTNALSGEGILTGIEWLSSAIKISHEQRR